MESQIVGGRGSKREEKGRGIGERERRKGREGGKEKKRERRGRDGETERSTQRSFEGLRTDGHILMLRPEVELLERSEGLTLRAHMGLKILGVPAS